MVTPQRKAYDASSKWPEAVDPWLQSPGTPRWPQQIGTRLALSKWIGCLNWKWWLFDTGLHFNHLNWDCGHLSRLQHMCGRNVHEWFELAIWHLALKHHWHIHDHANVLNLWDVHGFLRFLKQRHLSVCLCLGLGPFPDWRTARNMTMALVTRPVRTLPEQGRPHFTTF